MRQKSILIFTIFSVFIILAPFLGGCSCSSSTNNGDAEDAPFYPDRVVTVRFVMTEENWTYLKEHAIEESYVKADMWYDGELIPDIAVRPKGKTSLLEAISRGSIKLPLKVDLNFFNAERNLNGVKKLTFNNNWGDPSFLREVLGYKLFEQMGIPTPRAAFVDIFVNDIHLGLYTMVEQIDKNFLSRHYQKTNGNLYKPEPPAGYLNWTEEDIDRTLYADINYAYDINLGGGKFNEILKALGQETIKEEPENVALPPPIDISQNESIDYLELMRLKTNNNNPDYTALFRFLEVLNKEPEKTFVEEIEKVLDVDEVLRYLAVSSVIVQLDTYTGQGHNYYLYEVDGKFTIIPWEVNIAFMSRFSDSYPSRSVNSLVDKPITLYFPNPPLFTRLLAVPKYLEIYHKHIKELIDGPFSFKLMNNRINELADMIRPYVIADDLKFYDNNKFLYEINENFTAVDYLRFMDTTLFLDIKSFVAIRIASVQAQLSGEIPSNSYGKSNGGL